MFIYCLEHGRCRASKEKIRRMCDDSTTVRRIGGLWYATFNKDSCRTLNDSKLYATLNINSHHAAPQRASVASLSQAKAADYCARNRFAATSEYRWSFGSAQFSGDVYKCSGFCKWDVRQEFNPISKQ